MAKPRPQVCPCCGEELTKVWRHLFAHSSLQRGEVPKITSGWACLKCCVIIRLHTLKFNPHRPESNWTIKKPKRKPFRPSVWSIPCR